MFLNEEQQFILANLVNDDYQNGNVYSGEPVSIVNKSDTDSFILQFFFKNTDEDVAEEWVVDFFNENGFSRNMYELFNLSGVDTFITACFALTDAGVSRDYSYSLEEQSLILPLDQINISQINIDQTNIASESSDIDDFNQSDIDLNNSNSSVDVSSIKQVSKTSSKVKKNFKTSSGTSSNASTTSVTTAASILSSIGQSLSGKSARVSTLDANGNKVSAAKQIQAFIDKALPNITDKEMAILTDSEQCKKMASLGFPLFMEVNPNLDYKTQARFLGKYRYGKKITNILGKDYYTTNHLFERNISRVEKMLTNLGLI